MSVQRIWLLRHAESEWNALRRWQGHADPPLSQRGLREARDAAAGIVARVGAAGRPLRLFSSDLQRAAQTAAAVAEPLGLAVTAVGALRELDVGSWSGSTREQIAVSEADALAAFDTGDPDARAGGGETRRELQARVRAAARRLARGYPDEDLLLVVHRGVIRALVPGCDVANLGLVETSLQAILAGAGVGPPGVRRG